MVTQAEQIKELQAELKQSVEAQNEKSKLVEESLRKLEEEMKNQDTLTAEKLSQLQDSIGTLLNQPKSEVPPPAESEGKETEEKRNQGENPGQGQTNLTEDKKASDEVLSLLTGDSASTDDGTTFSSFDMNLQAQGKSQVPSAKFSLPPPQELTLEDLTRQPSLALHHTTKCAKWCAWTNKAETGYWILQWLNEPLTKKVSFFATLTGLSEKPTEKWTKNDALNILLTVAVSGDPTTYYSKAWESLQQSGTETVDEFLQRMTGLAEILVAIGKSLSDTEVKTKFAYQARDIFTAKLETKLSKPGHSISNLSLVDIYRMYVRVEKENAATQPKPAPALLHAMPGVQQPSEALPFINGHPTERPPVRQPTRMTEAQQTEARALIQRLLDEGLLHEYIPPQWGPGPIDFRSLNGNRGYHPPRRVVELNPTKIAKIAHLFADVNVDALVANFKRKNNVGRLLGQDVIDELKQTGVSFRCLTANCRPRNGETCSCTEDQFRTRVETLKAKANESS